MDVAELVKSSNLIGNCVEIQGLLISDSEHCWLEDEKDQTADRIILEKDGLFGIVGRQVSLIIGGKYPICYPSKVRGVLSKAGTGETDYALRELSSIIVTTSNGDVSLDLSEGAGDYDLIFE